MKSAYVCLNCGTGVTQKHVNGYKRVGFELHHIACPECGEHCLCVRECTVPCPICGKPILEEREFCSVTCRDEAVQK